jgi:hypothetical protein
MVASFSLQPVAYQPEHASPDGQAYGQRPGVGQNCDPVELNNAFFYLKAFACLREHWGKAPSDRKVKAIVRPFVAL